ncbi:hypothetical protein [Rhodococcus sp. W8901]|uniref:hypothetical protein n=1 Tax=Rhodococcus sp. W8901 TaxID=2742603 RepID=UPI001581DBCB|nr:hypothetical protein [Rhodococcus sp. W8901]QKT12147.1 hypothetical protein HUN07_16820 [Rhodococcus sp. W8901]
MFNFAAFVDGEAGTEEVAFVGRDAELCFEFEGGGAEVVDGGLGVADVGVARVVAVVACECELGSQLIYVRRILESISKR